jgi:hypothetical protein
MDPKEARLRLKIYSSGLVQASVARLCEHGNNNSSGIFRQLPDELGDRFLRHTLLPSHVVVVVVPVAI